MPKQTPQRPRGRPRRSEASITPARILDAALALLEERGEGALTMRSLARRIGADPMAIYHYYADKNALLEAAAERAFAALRPRLPPRGGWRDKLHALARAYLRFLHRSGELLRYVVGSPRASSRASPRFDELFFAIIAPLSLSDRLARASRDALVDQLHGCSLASASYDPTASLDVLFTGMSALCSMDGPHRLPAPRRRVRRSTGSAAARSRGAA